jgi:hypothetical protein
MLPADQPGDELGRDGVALDQSGLALMNHRNIATAGVNGVTDGSLTPVLKSGPTKAL